MASALTAVRAVTLSQPERHSDPAEAPVRLGPADRGLGAGALPQGNGTGAETPAEDPAPSAPRRPLPERAALLTGARAGGCRGRPAAGRSRPRPLRWREGLAPPSCSGASVPTAGAAADAAAASATPPPATRAKAGAGRGRAGRGGARGRCTGRHRQGEQGDAAAAECAVRPGGEAGQPRERSWKPENGFQTITSSERRGCPEQGAQKEHGQGVNVHGKIHKKRVTMLLAEPRASGAKLGGRLLPEYLLNLVNMVPFQHK